MNRNKATVINKFKIIFSKSNVNDRQIKKYTKLLKYLSHWTAIKETQLYLSSILPNKPKLVCCCTVWTWKQVETNSDIANSKITRRTWEQRKLATNGESIQRNKMIALNSGIKLSKVDSVLLNPLIALDPVLRISIEPIG